MGAPAQAVGNDSPSVDTLAQNSHYAQYSHDNRDRVPDRVVFRDLGSAVHHDIRFGKEPNPESGAHRACHACHLLCCCHACQMHDRKSHEYRVCPRGNGQHAKNYVSASYVCHVIEMAPKAVVAVGGNSHAYYVHERVCCVRWREGAQKAAAAAAGECR